MELTVEDLLLSDGFGGSGELIQVYGVLEREVAVLGSFTDR